MMNLNLEICNAFDKRAQEYEQAAKIQNEIGRRLFERLHYLKISPRYVLDLGCGTGLFSLLLKKHYPQAKIIGLDLSKSMLLQAKKKQGWLCKWPLINGDMTNLPFADGVFDLIFSNQVIHWSQPLNKVVNELNRVMNTNGCLMFSTLGPDTFKELKQAWVSADNYAHANTFLDMHEVGDYLLAEHFVDPVVDMEVLAVHYANLNQLLQSLKSQGVRNINPDRNKGLTGKNAWQQFEAGYQTLMTAEGKYPLTYEVVYGHAWKGEKRRVGSGTETFISVSDIRRRDK